MQKACSFIDESFDASLTQSYYMSIRFSSDGLSFCTLDPVRNRFIQFKQVPVVWDGVNCDPLEGILADEPLFKHNYQKVVVIVDNQWGVLVPSMLYVPERALQMLAFTFHDDLEAFVAMENKIKLADAVNVFAIPRHLFALMGQLFGDVHYLHGTTPLLESNMVLAPSQVGSTLIRVHIESQRFFITVIENRHLKLFNSFELKAPNDLVYFVLYVIEQCRLNANDLELSVSGDFTPDNHGVKLLKDYFKRVRSITNDQNLAFAPSLRDVDYLNHFQLFNFGICV